jgi:hypothetical protein
MRLRPAADGFVMRNVLMTRRRVLLLGSIVVVAALGVGVWLRWPRQTAITQENAARIEAGMSRAEVEAILGGPARFEASSDCVIVNKQGFFNGVPFDSAGVSRPKVPDPTQWVSDCALILVVFDEDGTVKWSHAWSSRPTETFVEKIRRWLGL